MKNNWILKKARTAVALAFWIFIWWIAAIHIDKEVLVVSPLQVATRLVSLMQTTEFYMIIAHSVLRIVTGFILAVVIGTVFGVLTAKFPILDTLITPLLSLIKATPVASFIILALVWINKESIPSFISFLMVLPIIHGNVSVGCKNISTELIEMTHLYRFSFVHKFTKLYIPSIFSYFMAGFKTSLGLAWKAGVAAEVLCFPKYAIGTQLYEAKTYLETLDIFTWTITIVMISVLIEKSLMWLAEKLLARRTSL